MLIVLIISCMTRNVKGLWRSYRGTFTNLGHAGNSTIIGPMKEARLLWQFSGDSLAGFVGSAAITNDELCIIGDLAGKMYALDISTGSVVWKTKN